VKRRNARTLLAIVFVSLLLGGIAMMPSLPQARQRSVVAYFDNSTGIFVGDDVVILGVKVGQIDRIEPQPERARVTFSIGEKYQVPADVSAVIVSPKLITSRAIQLTPAYVGGPTLADGAVIPQNRTAVPVEFDDFRKQLEKLTESLQPTEPGGVSPLAAVVNTAADNLRGQGQHIRDTIIKLSQAISTIGDRSDDVFGTVKNLSTLVGALHDSADLMGQLNNNLASVTSLLTNDPDEVAHAVDDFNAALTDVTEFVAENREALGTTSDKLASVSTALVESIDDVKQTLHVLPNVLQNFNNIYEPAHGSITGILGLNNMTNPITFLCGAIQAASRLNGDQAAKLCVQYLAPIVKNRQYNFPPIGVNPLVNAQARPNEVTYSEDWMRPDYRPTPPAGGAPPPGGVLGQPTGADLPAGQAPLLPAEATPTDPADGLAGIMIPPGGG
jgi:phospholipid/cholesterol/gamma-HCH transport system substrate-binding protein